MLTLRGDRHVAVVVRPVDRVLDVMRLALIPIALMVVSAQTLQAFVGLGVPANNWLLVPTAVATLLAYIGLLQTEPVGSRVDLLFARMRRRVTMACDPGAAGTNPDSRMACWLTPEALRGPLFRYEEQLNAVRKLTAACRDEGPGGYWFLEGRSGSGKTRTGLLLVQTLVRDPELVGFGDRSFLYDFGEAPGVQDELVKSLGSTRHDRAVVLVDNFQLVRPDVLREVTRRLVDHASAPSERLILFLCRPAHAWNLSPGSDVRLVSEAKASDRHIQLPGPPSESIIRSLSEVDPPASQLIAELQDKSSASAPQLHLAQVVARNRRMPPEVATILALLDGEIHDATALDLVRTLAAITGLSMHSGTFSGRAYRAALGAVDKGESRRAALVSRARAQARLRRLRRIGLISRRQAWPDRYVFHEAVAKLCIDRLSPLPAFQIPFTIVGKARLDDALSAGDLVSGWLIAVEIGAHEAAQECFDAAMANGPYTRMVRCLQRADVRYELSPAPRLQLAILLDRTGDFAASRREFTEELMQTLDPSSELAAMFAASRLEASHDEASAAGLELLLSHPDRVVAIVGEYWKLHIAAHDGSFASQRLLELATEALGLLGSRESHWLDYSLGRMHFDSLRHHYLQGGDPVEAVAAPQRRAIAAHLRSRLASFEAFDILYTKAHLVSHVLLPRLGIYYEPVSPEHAKLADIGQQDVATVDDLVRAAQRLYRRAQDEFSQYGDREGAYLEADVLNAQMIERNCDLEGLTVKLHEYERFILDTGFPDIASYPQLYFLRWHMLRYYRCLLQTPVPATDAADVQLASAQERLRRVVELDSEVGNEYGLMRARLLELLLQWVREPPDAERVTSLAAEVQSRGYAREARLLDRLAGSRLLPIDELHAIFRFYPFVGQ